MLETLRRIHSLDHQGLVHELLHFPGRLRLDFTESFLTRLSIDQLRHLLAAACLQSAQPAPSVAVA